MNASVGFKKSEGFWQRNGTLIGRKRIVRVFFDHDRKPDIVLIEVNLQKGSKDELKLWVKESGPNYCELRKTCTSIACQAGIEFYICLKCPIAIAKGESQENIDKFLAKLKDHFSEKVIKKSFRDRKILVSEAVSRPSEKKEKSRTDSQFPLQKKNAESRTEDPASSMPLELEEKQRRLLREGIELNHPDGIYIAMIPLGLIDANPEQPRKFFEKKALMNLAETLRGGKKGIARNKQPIMVTERSGRFLIIDGERRWRAAKQAGRKKIFALVFPDKTDMEVLVDSCLLNFCRENMSEYDRANAYKHLMEKNAWKQAELAKAVGVDPQAISNALQYFKIKSSILKMIEQGKLKESEVKPLGVYQKDDQETILNAAREKGLIGAKKTPKDQKRLLKKMAQEMDIWPKNADRRLTSYEEMTARAVNNKLKAALGALESFGEKEIKAIESSEKVTMAEICKNAKELMSQLERICV